MTKLNVALLGPGQLCIKFQNFKNMLALIVMYLSMLYNLDLYYVTRFDKSYSCQA